MAQEASPHCRAGCVEHAKQRARLFLGTAVAEDFQVAQSRRIQAHEGVERVRPQAVETAQERLLRLFQIGQQSTGGAGRQRQVGAAKAVERAHREHPQQRARRLLQLKAPCRKRRQGRVRQMQRLAFGDNALRRLQPPKLSRKYGIYILPDLRGGKFSGTDVGIGQSHTLLLPDDRRDVRVFFGGEQLGV